MKQDTQPGGSCPVMDAPAIEKSLRRMAHEIVEQTRDDRLLILAGIPTRGAVLAVRLAALIDSIGPRPLFCGTVDVSMHRDDLATRRRVAALQPTRLPVAIDGAELVLVDDVFFTGRTVRAALDAVGSFGRPSRIRLAVLVDRGHRELPLRADFVGKNIPTAPGDRVRVRLEESDGVRDSVQLIQLEERP